MTTRIVVVLSILISTTSAMAAPSLSDGEEMQGSLSELDQLDLSTITPRRGDEPLSTQEPAARFSSANIGMRLFGWLLSTSFYGFCLTNTFPNIGGDGEDPMVAMSRIVTTPPSTNLDISSLASWEVSVAPALGVVLVSVGKGEAQGRALTPIAPPRVQLALLPIGPERAAGFSVMGCFR